jgi:hypothetical protein
MLFRTKPLLFITLACMVGFQLFFFWNEFLEDWTPLWVQSIEASMDEVRGAIMLIQVFGIAVLFIDYVTRFDELSHPFWQGLAVGTCMIGWLLQIFVYFLDSAYLV